MRKTPLYIILLISFFALSGCRSTQIEPPIDTEAKALQFAKEDEGFVGAETRWRKEEILYNVFYDEDGIWNVSAWPQDTYDLWYEIVFDADGNIIKRGYGNKD